MRRTLSLLVVGALLAVAMPVQAVPSALLESGPLVVRFNSDGTLKLARANELGTDSYQECGGIAPIQNSCTLQDTTTFPFGGGWSIGLFFPGSELAPAGALVGSVVIHLTGSKHMDQDSWTLVDEPYTLHWGCNWMMVNVFGLIVGDWNCGELEPRTAIPAGDLTAVIHAGALDQRLPVYGLGTYNEDEYGIGTWKGFLEAS